MAPAPTTHGWHVDWDDFLPTGHTTPRWLDDPGFHEPPPGDVARLFHRYKESRAQTLELFTSNAAIQSFQVSAYQAEAIRAWVLDTVARSRDNIALSLMARRLTSLHQRMESQESRLAALEAALAVQGQVSTPEIDWSLARDVVADVADQLGWSARIHVDEEEGRIGVYLRDDEEDSLVHAGASFYEHLATALGADAFRRIDFELVADSELYDHT